MNLKFCKKTKKNMETLYAVPKRCSKCDIYLEDVSRLMSGISYHCKNCGKTWHHRGLELYEILKG